MAGITTTPDRELLEEMFADTAGSYDLVVRLATLGMDIWWKRRLMRMIPHNRTYRRILDLGCGTGIVTMQLAERFPDAEVIGIDLSRGAGLWNMHFFQLIFIWLKLEFLWCARWG